MGFSSPLRRQISFSIRNHGELLIWAGLMTGCFKSYREMRIAQAKFCPTAAILSVGHSSLGGGPSQPHLRLDARHSYCWLPQRKNFACVNPFGVHPVK